MGSGLRDWLECTKADKGVVEEVVVVRPESC